MIKHPLTCLIKLSGNEEISNNQLAEKLLNIAKDLRKPKPIPSTLKNDGKIVIMDTSKPFKNINKDISDIVSTMSSEEFKKGFVTRYDFKTNDVIHLIYDKNGKHTIGRFDINESPYN